MHFITSSSHNNIVTIINTEQQQHHYCISGGRIVEACNLVPTPPSTHNHVVPHHQCMLLQLTFISNTQVCTLTGAILLLLIIIICPKYIWWKIPINYTLPGLTGPFFWLDVQNAEGKPNSFTCNVIVSACGSGTVKSYSMYRENCDFMIPPQDEGGSGGKESEAAACRTC